MSSTVEKQLQDKLLLEMLDLIEQSVQCKINIETTTNAGQLLLAKSRYIDGAQSVSKSRLPTENSVDFNALKTVIKTDDPQNSPIVSDSNELELSVQTVDKSNGFIDPIRWFGVLVPRSLQLAQERFNRAIEMVIESANIQLKLDRVTKYLLLLRNK